MKNSYLAPAVGAIALLLSGCAASHERNPTDAGGPVGEGAGCVSFGDTTLLTVTAPAADPASCLAISVAVVEGERWTVDGDVEVSPGYGLVAASRLGLACDRLREGEYATSGAAVTRAEGAITVWRVPGDRWDLEAHLALELEDGGRESLDVRVLGMSTCLP
ncbi:MAG: hypothetical protein VYE22_22335 [Myxococcota bacterium]|nr:hypothetical protein [Myxococcota bacterium]